MADRALKIELFDQFARVAQALASGRRVEIVDVLANGAGRHSGRHAHAVPTGLAGRVSVLGRLAFVGG